jgi:hypothetical protein
MEFGKCKLCLQDKDLQESHLLPRALYRMSRGAGRKGNQDPHVLRRTEQKSSSFQVKAPLFCRECEQRLSTNGENYVMPMVTQKDGRFPLLEILTAAAARSKTPAYRGYSKMETPEIDRAKIAYFAISIFWRASIHTWKADNGEEIRLDLGKHYNEEMRRYLLGEIPLPKHAFLITTACADLVSQQNFFMPGENKKIKDRSYGVGLRGLFLLFRISKTPPEWHVDKSMINNPREWIAVWDCFANKVWSLGEGT